MDSLRFPVAGLGLLCLCLLLSTCHAFARHNNKNRWGPEPVSVRPSSTSLSSTSHRIAQSESSAPSQMVNGEEESEETCFKTAEIFSLDSIRSTLIRQEETIIFALIERAQFRHNSIVYERGGFGDLGQPLGSRPTPVQNDVTLSFLEYFLAGTEALHCEVRRYTSPEEHPFFPERLPPGPMDALPRLDYPNLLSNIGGASDVNFNPILLRKYTDVIVPSLTSPGDDEQHGSTVLCDIAALQALSRRVHYGKFVAESKYRADPDAYERLVERGDADGVMKLLTNELVEEQVLRRARLKAATYGREPLLSSMPSVDGDDTTAVLAAAAASAVVAAVEALSNETAGKKKGKVDPAVIESVYRDIVIPLTKDIEVAYLFRRCGKDPPPQYAPDRMSVDCNQDL